MIHQPLGGAQGQAADIEIQANEILHHKLTLNGYLAEFTGQGMERLTQDTGQGHTHGRTSLLVICKCKLWRVAAQHARVWLLHCLTQLLWSCI